MRSGQSSLDLKELDFNVMVLLTDQSSGLERDNKLADIGINRISLH